MYRPNVRGGVGFIPKRLHSETSSFRTVFIPTRLSRHVFNPKIKMYYFSPKRLHSEQSSLRKFTSSLRQVFSPNLKTTSSVRIWKPLRQSEFENVSPNLKKASSVRIWKEIRSDDVLFKFGLKTCFLNSEWRRALFFRTEDVLLRFGLTKCFLLSDWRT